jgi:cytoskeletal protein RodZ
MNIAQTASQSDKNALGVTYETAISVGTRLKYAREQRCLSHLQISARVKIRDRYIEAIEIGDWDILPPGLNGRGLVRLYAKELGVSIPEFQSFQHLQTVMMEKQSENLMVSSHKKSKYHPAAEESAEVIRSISRRDFQKGFPLDQTENLVSAPQYREYGFSNNPKIFLKAPLYQQRGNATGGAVVTPNIYEILGLEFEEREIHIQVPGSNADAVVLEHSINKTLPTAEPIKRSSPERQQKSIEHPNHFTQEEKKDLSTSISEQTSEKEIQYTTKRKFLQLIPGKILILSLLFVFFLSISLFLFLSNSHQIKITKSSAKLMGNSLGTVESLPHSIIDANVPLAQEENKNSFSEDSHDTSNKISNFTTESALTDQTTVNTPLEKIAKLSISSRVNIMIEADGQQIFSGVHSAGILEIPFKIKTEINISDASKVSLLYEGFDHGILGYSGRKRKIVLNAKPYLE